jgi:hypothetical protein
VSKVIFDIGNMLIRREGARSRSLAGWKFSASKVILPLLRLSIIKDEDAGWRARRSQGERANYFYHEILMKGPDDVNAPSRSGL